MEMDILGTKLFISGINEYISKYDGPNKSFVHENGLPLGKESKGIFIE